MTDKDDFSARVAREVKRWMGLRGISQQDAATLLGISPQAMSRRASFDTPYSLDELNVLATAIGVRVSVFLGEPPRVTELRTDGPLPEPPERTAVRPRRGRKIAERRPTIPKVIICQPNRVRPVTSRYHRVHLLTSGEATHTHRAA